MPYSSSPAVQYCSFSWPGWGSSPSSRRGTSRSTPFAWNCSAPSDGFSQSLFAVVDWRCIGFICGCLWMLRYWPGCTRPFLASQSDNLQGAELKYTLTNPASCQFVPSRNRRKQSKQAKDNYDSRYIESMYVIMKIEDCLMEWELLDFEAFLVFLVDLLSVSTLTSCVDRW